MSTGSHRGHRRSLAVTVAALVLLGACSSSDGGDAALDTATTTSSTTVPSEPDGGATDVTDPAPTTSTPAVPPISWEPCGGDECATVAVPRDHDRLEGPTIDLAVRRKPATGDRIGALFFNFGGPGSPTTSLLQTFPVPSRVRERFDLVAVDPRGVGGSTPLDCGLDPATLYSADPTVDDAADARRLVEVSVRYAEDCAETHGELLPHLGTRDVARDLDLVRAAMGDERIDFVGYSYGTAVGQAYAELFPHRVRTMVLDGLVDPASEGVDLAVEQARGFETALANWAEGCDTRSSCRLEQPLDAVDRVLAAAEGEIPSSGGTRALGPGEATLGLAFPLYARSLWPALDGAVAAALDGDGTELVQLARRYHQLVEFPAYFAVSCLDSSWPRSTDELLARAAEAGEEVPRFGEAIVNDYLRCAVWPVPPDPLGPITAPDAPPILVVSTTGDPATPYENGVAVADRLDPGVLLTHEGEGHTIVFQGSPCVDRVVIDYLIDQVVPPDGNRC